MCSSTWVLWFFLSLDCPASTRIKERKKIDTRLKRWTIALLDTRSTNKEYSEKVVALRRNRSRSRRYQQQESSLLLTRASSALHFSDADSIRFVWELSEIPLFWCVLFCSRQRRKENFFGRMNSGEKNQTRAHFSPKRTTTPEHIFAPPILWEGALKTSEDTRPNAR